MHYGFGMWDWMAVPFIGPLFAVLAVWSIFWKGLALWHAAQRDEPWWFVILLVVNTAGILDIIYLFAFAKLTFSTLFSSRIKKHTAVKDTH